MPSQNLSTVGTKPDEVELLTLHVLRSERVSTSFVRVTLGGDDLAGFTPMGHDQWFRLFIPVSDVSLSRVPKKLSTLSYLKFLTVSKTDRPVLRNYTVRAFRPDGPDGPELDVDVVVHGSAADGTAGPASAWAETCTPGDPVAILDEGVGFTLRDGVERVLLVTDETGLPALEGILGSLPAGVAAEAFVEVPTADDRREIASAADVTVEWVVRTDPSARPGEAVLARVVDVPFPEAGQGWVVGESSLPVAVRRAWVAAGVPKDDFMFCGYWKAGKAH